VLQEFFLLAWCGAVTSLCRSEQVLRAVVRTWCLSSTCWAGFMVIALLAGQDDLAGLHRADGGRAELNFDHPNMAGNYFMASFFMVLAARCPTRPFMRAVACVTLLAAMLYAGSNTALLGLGVGLLVMLFIYVRRRSDHVAAVAVVLCVALGGGVAWSFIAEPVMSAIDTSENRLVRYSVARSSRSADNREALFASQYELFEQSNLVGIGPAKTKSALGTTDASTAKEAHSDYLASLVERGPLGVIGLVALFGAVGVRTIAVSSAPTPIARDPALPNGGALSGALVAFAIAGITHEVLHYRHLWTLLAVLAAQYLLTRRYRGASGTVRAGGPVRTARSPDGS
jgi:O-antigen ligase